MRSHGLVSDIRLGGS